MYLHSNVIHVYTKTHYAAHQNSMQWSQGQRGKQQILRFVCHMPSVTFDSNFILQTPASATHVDVGNMPGIRTRKRSLFREGEKKTAARN